MRKKQPDPRRTLQLRSVVQIPIYHLQAGSSRSSARIRSIKLSQLCETTSGSVSAHCCTAAFWKSPLYRAPPPPRGYRLMTTSAKNTRHVTHNSEVVGDVSMVLSPVTGDTKTSRRSSLAFLRHLESGCLPNFRPKTVTGPGPLQQRQVRHTGVDLFPHLRAFQNKTAVNAIHCQ